MTGPSTSILAPEAQESHGARAGYELDVEGDRMRDEYQSPCPQALSHRRQRRRMGAGRPVPAALARRRAAAALSAARGLQRPALDCARRGALAPAADQLPALVDRLPVDPSLAGRRLLRGAGARPAPAVAPGARSRRTALGGDPGCPRPPVEPREWGTGRLRRAQAPQRLQGARGGGHAGPIA